MARKAAADVSAIDSTGMNQTALAPRQCIDKGNGNGNAVV
jgi:hypothetical protein